MLPPIIEKILTLHKKCIILSEKSGMNGSMPRDWKATAQHNPISLAFYFPL